MFSIGEFARHGRVSVRMLRHYDAIGLLRPASVDAASGYRFYQASQLAELNRIIALKDLGFTLHQVQAILAEQVSAAELRGMLKLRRAEIHAQIEAETARLARVEARLLTIEDEARVPVDGVVIKRLAPVRVGELTGTAAVRASASSPCPRWTPRRPSSTTAPWTTCCPPARPWRCWHETEDPPSHDLRHCRAG
jgi:DNA-binding transcriptional MerR regulator